MKFFIIPFRAGHKPRKRLQLIAEFAQHDFKFGQQITCSIGVAEALNEDSESLVKRADIALYNAKANGRDRVELAD